MRSSLTMLGIVIGVASVITMVALGRGAATKITADIANMGTNLLIASPGQRAQGTHPGGRPALQAGGRAGAGREGEAGRRGRAGREPGRAAGEREPELEQHGDRLHQRLLPGAGLQVRAGGRLLGRPAPERGGRLRARAPRCAAKLFGSQDPVGSSIRIGKVDCTVVGVTRSKGQASLGQRPGRLRAGAARHLPAAHRRQHGRRRALRQRPGRAEQITRVKGQITPCCGSADASRPAPPGLQRAEHAGDHLHPRHGHQRPSSACWEPSPP